MAPLPRTQMPPLLLSPLLALLLRAPSVSAGSTKRKDEPTKLQVAVIGGGVAGSVTTLELLQRDNVEVVIFEQAEKIGNTKSPSGIASAVLTFASMDKYWARDDLAYAELLQWFKMDMPKLRIFDWMQRAAYRRRVLKDIRMSKAYQQDFFKASRERLEEMLDRYPELCDAIVGPFCCREGSAAQAWMMKKGATRTWSCDALLGVAHVFSTEKLFAAANRTDEAKKRNFDILLPGNHTKQHGMNLNILEEIIKSRLAGAIWNSVDEGFVRVEKFYDILNRIFERSGRVQIKTNCFVRKILPKKEGKVVFDVPLVCSHAQGRGFDRVIVASGVDSGPLLTNHDPGLLSELIPVKGYSALTTKQIVDKPYWQVGLNMEEDGQYVRPTDQGGLYYGFGRVIGVFEDELLNPSFDHRWVSGTGPNQTGIGRELFKTRGEGLQTYAGMRPVSLFLKFPLLKNFAGTWSPVLLNSGYGFYGYAMAWQSSKIIVDIALDGKPEQDQWKPACTVAVGEQICTPLHILFWHAVFLLANVGSLFVVVRVLRKVFPGLFESKVEASGYESLIFARAGVSSEQTLLAKLKCEPLLSTDERKKLFDMLGHPERYNSRPHSFPEQLAILCKHYAEGLISAREFEAGKVKLFGLDPKRLSQSAKNGSQEESHRFDVCHDMLFFCRVMMAVNFFVSVISFTLSYINVATPLIYILMVGKIFVTLALQRSWITDHMETWVKCLPLDFEVYRSVIASLNQLVWPYSSVWIYEAIITAAMIMDPHCVAATAGVASQLMPGEEEMIHRFQQSWHCTPVIGWFAGKIGLRFIFLSIFLAACGGQLVFALKHCNRAENCLKELANMKGDEAWSTEPEPCSLWNEYWRELAHCSELTSLALVAYISRKLCDATAERYSVETLRDTEHVEQDGKLRLELAKYGRMSQFNLCILMEAVPSLWYSVSLLCLCIEVMPPEYWFITAASICVSSCTILSGMVYQIANTKDIELNMSRRWYGYYGFLGQQLCVAMTGFCLVASWFRMLGIQWCDSHVYNVASGCVEWDPMYRLPRYPNGLSVFMLLPVPLIAIFVAVRTITTHRSDEDMAEPGSTSPAAG